MARRPNYSFERRQRELGKAAKKEAKREAQREAVERRRAGGDGKEGEEGAGEESGEKSSGPGSDGGEAKPDGTT